MATSRHGEAVRDLGALPPHMAARPITEREFRAFRELIHRLSGIHLVQEKKVLLVGRLNRRLRILGLSSFREYLDVLDGGKNELEAAQMLDCICTNETHFFREPQQFEFLEREAYPRWTRAANARERPRHIKVWSAACSTGEEPYSVAMSLLSHFPLQAGWTIDILATDLSTFALARAVAAQWPVDKASEIPERLLRRFMLRGAGAKEGLMAAGQELRSVVRFRRFNLIGNSYPSDRDFDVVFCRNVIIYFDAPTKAEVVSRLIGHVGPRGYLVLGHAESIQGLDARVLRHAPAIYSHRPSDEPSSGRGSPPPADEITGAPR